MADFQDAVREGLVGFLVLVGGWGVGLLGGEGGGRGEDFFGGGARVEGGVGAVG